MKRDLAALASLVILSGCGMGHVEILMSRNRFISKLSNESPTVPMS
jgi:hypothetical protein